ncbi:hypothetical protein TrLO_g2227 [Triparma laevis f. longispina]|uniref:Uncharacterized protein n=1 Tax=Triparma laevis f. longispina TaxID=1714387 RepID=A0A9W7F6G0_9STRA|nr:hypothetical protein TrLO_g2227 [Triparma laevis f. longispina]
MTLPSLPSNAHTALRKLNNPATILTTATAATYLTNSYDFSTLPLLKLKLIHIISFLIINIGSVSIPGRLDSELADQISAESKGKRSSNPSPLAVNSGRTLVSPAPWAFSIWGIIYILELISLLSLLTLSSESPLISIYTKITPYILLSSIYQSSWCATFRSKYVSPDSNIIEKICSPLFLTLTSVALSRVNSITNNFKNDRINYIKYFLGLSIHFAWTAAASLVNVNGILAYSRVNLTLQKYVAYISVLIAITLSYICKNNITVAFVLGWALKACGDGMKTRIRVKEGNLVGAREMMVLSYAGAGVCVLGGLGRIKINEWF